MAQLKNTDRRLIILFFLKSDTLLNNNQGTDKYHEPLIGFVGGLGQMKKLDPDDVIIKLINTCNPIRINS